MLTKILNILEIIITILIALMASGLTTIMGLVMFYMMFIDDKNKMLMSMPLRIIMFIFFILTWALTFYPFYKEEMRKIKKG